MIKIVDDVNKEYVKLYGFCAANAKLIKRDDDVVGMIDYEIHPDSVKIFYITVSSEYKRQGIATEVVEMIKQDHKDKYIYGDSLPGAIEFWESVGAEFDEDPDEDYLTPFHII